MQNQRDEQAAEGFLRIVSEGFAAAMSFTEELRTMLATRSALHTRGCVEVMEATCVPPGDRTTLGPEAAGI